MAAQIKPVAKPILVQKAIYAFAKLSWQARLGLALALLSLLAWFFVLMPKSAQLTQLKTELHQLKQSFANQPSQATQPEQPSEMEQFEAKLPAQKQTNAIIAQILQMATSQGLAIDKVEYTTQATPTHLQKLQIKLPSKGRYVQVRQLIKQLLSTYPSLALSEVNFNRDDLNVETVEADLLLTLYLKQDGEKYATH